MADDQKTKIIRTVCRECQASCGMLAHVENGRLIKLEADSQSPRTRDGLCWKTQASIERLYHPDRVHYPLKRLGERGEGKWQRITWDEALDTIAEKFNAIKNAFGAEFVTFIKGRYDRRCDLVSRLGNSFGTPNIIGIDNTCYIPSASGRLMTYGFDGRPDFSGSPDCIMLWGREIGPPIKPGTKFIVVNAIRTEAAKKADLWLQPRPATDLALALGILNVIVNERLYDQDFVDEWTIGFEKMAAHVQQFPPEKAAEITWVPAEKIVEAARVFAGSGYACLQTGNASEDTYNSTQFARAIAIIQAICGQLDIPGGTVQATDGPIDREGRARDVLCNLLPPEQSAKRLGSENAHFPADPLWEPIANKPAELQSQYIVRSILEGKPYEVKGAFIIGCNPVMTWSHSRRAFDALKKIGFLAVADLCITPSAFLADIVLPSASPLEADAVAVNGLGMGDTYLQAQQKVVQIGECRSDLEIIISLANRLGLGEYFWKDLHTYLDAYLLETGITFDELRRRNHMVSSGMGYRKYLNKGFNTPSGKVEICSSLCEKWGYEPLPSYYEPRETVVSAPELADEFPLILTSAHDKIFVHSQDRNLDVLRKCNPRPLVMIHPDTAAGLGIHEGDEVFIENKRGRIKQTATLSEDIDPRVISVAYGWWFPEKGPSGEFGWAEANINILTDDAPPYSPEIGSPSMRGFVCRVYKAD